MQWHGKFIVTPLDGEGQERYPKGLVSSPTQQDGHEMHEVGVSRVRLQRSDLSDEKLFRSSKIADLEKPGGPLIRSFVPALKDMALR